MTLDVSAYTPDDLPECIRIINQNYYQVAGIVLTRELNESLASQNPHALKFIVLREDGEVRGFASLSASRMQAGFYELCWVNVDPAHQNKGLGTYLVRTMIDLCSQMKPQGLMLFAGRAHTLYARFGFRELSRYGDDRLMMLNFA
jgi:N-acetylglutamate synthase-like GNAT family acetyltransferase